jgi:hypothetical protein
MGLDQAAGPVFTRMLTNLQTCLDKAEAHAKEKGYDPAVLCQARLAPDMLPLTGQVHIATAFAKNAMCRLSDKTPPDFNPPEATFEAYRARIKETLAIVASVSAKDFEGAAERKIEARLGPDRTEIFTGTDYFNSMVMPNFYFHLTTAYAILRHNGVPLGKMDFLGL